MTKKEAKQIALETIMESIGCAYYKICDDNSIQQKEQEMIIIEINKLGERIGKTLKREYVSY